MGAVLGATIDFIHALLMAAWVLGLPLLFWHRWPRLSRAYAYYAISFIVINRISYALLGECFLTTLARHFWTRADGSSGDAAKEWFAVRLSTTIFHVTPSHGAVKLASEALILVTAAGLLFRLSASSPHAAPPRPR